MTDSERQGIHIAAANLGLSRDWPWFDDCIQCARISIWRAGPIDDLWLACTVAKRAMIDQIRQVLGDGRRATFASASIPRRLRADAEECLDTPEAIYEAKQFLDRLTLQEAQCVQAVLTTDEKREAALSLGVSAGRVSQILGSIRQREDVV
jgi:hypothetical protein